MFAQGKPCFGVTDDFRYLNNMLWGICGEGRRIAPDITGLLGLVAAWHTAGEPAGATPHTPAPVQRSLLAEAEAILRRRNEEFIAQGGPAPTTLETVGWTLDELLEEAGDADYATRDNSRVRDLSIARELVALLRAALEPGDDRRA